MKDAIRNLIFLTILLFSISYDSLVTGVSYDKRHKLHPEISNFCADCCWFSAPIYEYGNRWIRLGQISFAIGLIVMFTTLTVAVREEKSIKTVSILAKEERDKEDF